MTARITNKLAAIAAAMILTLPAACLPESSDVSVFHPIKNEAWAYPDAVNFTIDHTDSIAEGQLYVAIRHTSDYLYSNLWTEVKRADADSVISIDTVNITLADKYGNWTGEGSGIWKQLEVPVGKPYRHRSGQMVSIRHIMRVDTLQGIDLIGVKFVKTK